MAPNVQFGYLAVRGELAGVRNYVLPPTPAAGAVKRMRERSERASQWRRNVAEQIVKRCGGLEIAVTGSGFMLAGDVPGGAEKAIPAYQAELDRVSMEEFGGEMIWHLAAVRATSDAWPDDDLRKKLDVRRTHALEGALISGPRWNTAAFYLQESNEAPSTNDWDLAEHKRFAYLVANVEGEAADLVQVYAGPGLFAIGAWDTALRFALALHEANPTCSAALLVTHPSSTLRSSARRAWRDLARAGENHLSLLGSVIEWEAAVRIAGVGFEMSERVRKGQVPARTIQRLAELYRLSTGEGDWKRRYPATVTWESQGAADREAQRRIRGLAGDAAHWERMDLVAEMALLPGAN